MKVVVEVIHPDDVSFCLGDPPVLTSRSHNTTSVAMFVPPCGVTLIHHRPITTLPILISVMLPQLPVAQ